MHGIYPEDSNIIDFNYIKLLQLAERYGAQNQEELSAACYSAIDMYLAGAVNVYFRKGEPYISSIASDDDEAYDDMPE